MLMSQQYNVGIWFAIRFWVELINISAPSVAPWWVEIVVIDVKKVWLADFTVKSHSSQTGG